MATRHRVALFGAALVLGAAFAAVPGTAARAAEGEATVTIVALRFTPDRLEISTGTVVVWENDELIDYPVVRGAHKIVADDGSFASAEISPGTRFSHRYLLPGTFPYHCGLGHAGMTGTVVVTGEPVHEPTSHAVAIREGSPGDPDSWGFSPQDITVEQGDTVAWRNEGSTAHTVTSDDDTFDSGQVAPGKTWQRRFGSAGVYRYHCTPHPWMTAVVRVAPPGGEPPPEPPEPPEPSEPETGGRPPPPATSAVVPPGSTAGPARVTMRIVEPDPSSVTTWGFVPREVQIRTGDTVVWPNEGSLPHTVTADDGSFDGEVAPGSTWERRFEVVGRFAFHCTPHPWMKGTVVVSRHAVPPAPGSIAAPADTPDAPASAGVPRADPAGPAHPEGPADDDGSSGARAVGVAVRVAAWTWIAAFGAWFLRVAITRRRARRSAAPPLPRLPRAANPSRDAGMAAG